MTEQFKCLTPLAMFYMTIKLMTVLLIYKIVTLVSIKVTAATLIIPLWFVTGDIIAEVYGYNISKKVIWFALIFQFIFAFICVFLINLPSPADWVYQSAYNQVFGKLPRIVFASFIAITFGAFINAYLISKWKVILNGRLFWLRSLVSSIIGEAIFVIISLSMEYLGIVPIKTLVELIAVSFCTKILLNPILVIPSSFITAAIKKIEGVEVFDTNLEFNPFKIRSSLKISNDAILKGNTL